MSEETPSAPVRVIGGGRLRVAVDALREFADHIESSDEVVSGFAIVVTRAAGGVEMRYAGQELPTIGALEYAKHSLISRWRHDGEHD